MTFLICYLAFLVVFYGIFWHGVFFRWYDLWIGAYWDRKNKTLYIIPFPMFGVKFGFGKP